MPKGSNLGAALMVLALSVSAGSALQGQSLRIVTANTVGPTTAESVCGVPISQPAAVPAATSSPVIFAVAPCFQRQGGRSQHPPETYLRDIQLKVSRPSQSLWVPYDASAERTILEDVERLWQNHALADLSVDIRDFAFSNGVIGKLVTYQIVERQ